MGELTDLLSDNSTVDLQALQSNLSAVLDNLSLESESLDLGLQENVNLTIMT